MEILVPFDGISVEWEELKRTLQGCEDSLMVASRLQSFIQVCDYVSVSCPSLSWILDLGLVLLVFVFMIIYSVCICLVLICLFVSAVCISPVFSCIHGLSLLLLASK